MTSTNCQFDCKNTLIRKFNLIYDVVFRLFYDKSNSSSDINTISLNMTTCFSYATNDNDIPFNLFEGGITCLDIGKDHTFPLKEVGEFSSAATSVSTSEARSWFVYTSSEL